ncbi:MAG: hypothetical protein IJ572_03935 [Bacilli bacterium]|nr:hypothetical protein [Bacilli bacterium]
MNYNDEDKAIRNFIIIFLIVIVVAVGVFFFTKYVVNKETNTTEEVKEVEIDNSVAIVGTMLSKADKEYYVILYRSEDDNAYKYDSLKSKYPASGNSYPLYSVDLSNALNKKYYDKDNVNLKSDNVNDLRFGDITVLKVETGKITKSYDSVEKIKKVWNIEED